MYAQRLERWGAGVETQKNVRGEIGGWGKLHQSLMYAQRLLRQTYPRVQLISFHIHLTATWTGAQVVLSYMRYKIYTSHEQRLWGKIMQSRRACEWVKSHI